MSTALIQTKYQWPSTVRNPLARSHLIQRLEAGHSRKLTLISAPAGYGKSTLVHLWLASSRDPVAWLSLDANDNDIGVFLRYLVAAVQRFLMYASILDRFCAPLCDVMLQGIWAEEDEFSSQGILNQLREANLFLIALDSEDQWFRYHHLFQELLRHRLQAELSTEQIQVLHARVIDWLAAHGFLEEALEHALAVQNIPEAITIFTRQRADLLNKTRWQPLEQQLNGFPKRLSRLSQNCLLIEPGCCTTRPGGMNSQPL